MVNKSDKNDGLVISLESLEFPGANKYANYLKEKMLREQNQKKTEQKLAKKLAGILNNNNK